jgi:cell division protease FtsH
MLRYAAPLFKVTIVPRGKSLGAAWYLPDERQITTFEQMFDEMTATIAGRTAEEIFFGQSSTGALNDLERITKMAYAMISFYGMNSEIGTLSFYDSSGENAYGFQKPYSEKTAEEIDKQVKILIENAHKVATKIIMENKEKIEILATTLLEKEVIFRDDVEVIFGKRPFEEEKNIN